MLRLTILSLVLVFGTAPTAQALRRADCVGTVPHGTAAGACHGAADVRFAARPALDCPRAFAGVSLPATLPDGSGAPQAPRLLPVGAPALVPAFVPRPIARRADRLYPADHRPRETALRI